MISSVYTFLESWAFDTFYIAIGVFILEWMYAIVHFPALLPSTIDSLIFFGPIWMPFLILVPLWIFWKAYIQRDFRIKQPMTVLEIKLPREQIRSPLAMELFFATINLSGGEATFIDRNWLGKQRAEWSLELCSHEGTVHFYINCRKAFKHIVENQLYAQFPGLEISEVPDYAKQISYDPETMNLWGCEYKYAKPDPYPLRSYIDYGLDKDPKEEFKVDPITVIIEQLAYMKKGEYMWMQLIIRARKDDYVEGLLGLHKINKFAEDTKHEIKKMLKAAEDATGRADFNKLTQGQKEAIANMERALTKRTFEVGARCIYFGKNESFKPTNIPIVITFFAPFGSGSKSTTEFNSLAGTRWLIKYDYPWQDYKNIRKNHDKKLLFETYRRRDYFISPYRQVPLIMTTEELATLFHFPGEVSTTPSLARVPSRRAGAPANLPV